MTITAQTSTLRRTTADAVVIFFPHDEALRTQQIAELRKIFGTKIGRIIGLERFEGKENESVSFHTDGIIASPRVFLAGLGTMKELTHERIRRAAAAAAKLARTQKLKHIAFRLPAFTVADSTSPLQPREIAFAVTEGVRLALYRFERYLTEKTQKSSTVRTITLFTENKSILREVKRGMNEAKIICDGTCLARDLENTPANDMYPETLALAAQQSGARYRYRVELWDRKKIEAMGFGGLLAVNAGSIRPPRFIVMEHNAGQRSLHTIVLIGKGITFDTGGISIKPASGMAEMKMDMSGAAAVIGTLEVAARLDIPVHLIGLIPATENMPGGSAMRPGDIIRHYGGKTSEVDNTDAEGRLILADALAYASTFSPMAVIDLATLTGACVVALGHHATGMMGNNDELMAQLNTAGERTYERVWQLPLFQEYEKQIKSDIADVKNVGGRWAGAITAGLFLKKFIGDYHWVHLDIAGTAILEEELPYAAKGGSGVGVRLLTDFLLHRGQ